MFQNVSEFDRHVLPFVLGKGQKTTNNKNQSKILNKYELKSIELSVKVRVDSGESKQISYYVSQRKIHVCRRCS